MCQVYFLYTMLYQLQLSEGIRLNFNNLKIAKKVRVTKAALIVIIVQCKNLSNLQACKITKKIIESNQD